MLDVSPGFRERYELLRRLGRGGMGEVHLALDRELNRRVAIKFLLAAGNVEDHAVERFHEEARVCAALKHPHIVPLLSAGEDAGKLYLVFDHIEGMTLADHLVDKGRLQAAPTVKLATQVLGGLEIAHSLGIIHRDLKPGNIMLRDGSHDALVMDFGIAKKDGGRDFQTQRGVILGSPAYMAPEQIRGDAITPRIDLYALGCTIYHCLAGSPPYEAETEAEVLRLHLKGEPPRPLRSIDPEIPAALDRWVARALERDPGDRWPDAAAMREALVALGDSRAGPVPRTSFVSSRNRSLRQASERTQAQRSSSDAAVTGTGMTTAVEARGPPRPSRRWPRRATVATLLAVATVAAIVAAWLLRRPEVVVAGDRVRIETRDGTTASVHLAVTDITDAVLDPAGDGSRTLVSGTQDQAGWTFLVPLGPGEIVEGAVVRGRRGFSRRVYQLGPLAGLGIRLERALDGHRTDDLSLRLAKDPGYILNTTFMDGRPAGAKVSFRELIVKAVAKEPFGNDLVVFGQIASRMFTDPAVAVARKAAIRRSLIRLLPLDLLSMSQREPAALEVEALYRGFSPTRFQLPAGAVSRGDIELIRETTCWRDLEYSQWVIMDEWHNRGGPPPVPSREPPGERLPVRSDYVPARTYSAQMKDPPAPGSRLLLRAVAAYLDLKFYYEVTFRDPDGRELWYTILHAPADVRWLRAMDGTDPEVAYRNADDAASLLSTPLRFMSMTPRWGLIEQSFPASVIPPGPFTVEVRYRHLPGIPLQDISNNPRLSYLRLLDLRFER